MKTPSRVVSIIKSFPGSELKDVSEYCYWSGWVARHWPLDVVEPGLRFYAFDKGRRAITAVLEVTRGGVFTYTSRRSFANRVAALLGDDWRPHRGEPHWSRLPTGTTKKPCFGVAMRYKVVQDTFIPYPGRFPQLGWEKHSGRLARADRGRQDQLDRPGPNAETAFRANEYVHALRSLGERVAPAQKAMLIAHAQAPRGRLTVDHLARSAGYSTPQIVYSMYGRLGRWIGELSGHDISQWRVLTRVIGVDQRDAQDRVVWTMHLALREAIRKLGWLQNGRSRPLRTESYEPLIIPRGYKTTQTAIVELRRGQDSFRRRQIGYWKCCPLTGIEERNVLRAAHIKPWSVCTSKERLDVHNGILLSATFDALFDAGLISFADDGALLVSPSLREADRRCLKLRTFNKRVGFRPEHQRYLAYHRENVYLE